MGMGYYILDGKKPIEIFDIFAWAAWIETADRKIVRTVLNRDTRISTLFLGIDYQFGDSPPLLFETMVFGGRRDGAQWRYSTWDKAVAGHARAIDELTWGILSRPIQWLRRVTAWL